MCKRLEVAVVILSIRSTQSPFSLAKLGNGLVSVYFLLVTVSLSTC